jgi:hypothetical protein
MAHMGTSVSNPVVGSSLDEEAVIGAISKLLNEGLG